MTTQHKYLLKTHKNKSTLDPSGRPMTNDIWPVSGSCCWGRRLWRVGVTFTWLAAEHVLKVRGNTHLQVEFFKKSDLQIPWPPPPPSPADPPQTPSVSTVARSRALFPSLRSVVSTERSGPAAVGHLGHVIRLRGGDMALSLCSLWFGVRPGGVLRCRRGRGRDEGPSLSRTPTGGTLRSRGWSWGPGP